MRGVVREIVITVILALLFFVAIRSVVHNFEVNGYSMEPNLHDGQFVIVSKAAYWFSDPKRGDIVVFDAPNLNHDVIHRIVGLPGEALEIQRGQLYIDGEPMDEPYIQGSNSVSLKEIPEGNYFIIGDNRGASSSHIVSKDDIVGKAWLIYWPIDDWGFVPNHSWKSGSTEQEEPNAEVSVLQSSFPVDANVA